MDTPIEKHGSLNGTTWVEVLGAPASGIVRVHPANGISVYNADTVAHDIFFAKNDGGVRTTFWYEAAVPAGTHVVLPKKVVLNATDLSIDVKTDATATTTEPTYDTAAAELS